MAGSDLNAETILQQIIKLTAYQLSVNQNLVDGNVKTQQLEWWKDGGKRDKATGRTSKGNGFEFEDTVLMVLTDMLLATGQADAKARAKDADKDATEASLIALNTILAGPTECLDYCEHRTTTNSGWGSNTAAVQPNWKFDITQDNFNRWGYDGTGNAGRNNWNGRINFEDAQLSSVEKKFIAYIKSKSKYHNSTTGKSAIDAAKTMVQGKIDALLDAQGSIGIYELELDSLQDDEMRRIADIKEEFESLAADWLQLATYHCCDIVQGNTVECEDATQHLMEPINKVFPNALKKPDPARDCTRRLL